MPSKKRSRMPSGVPQGMGSSFIHLVDRSARRAVREAIAEHHRAGRSVSIWHNGRVMWLHPDGVIRAAKRRHSRPRAA